MIAVIGYYTYLQEYSTISTRRDRQKAGHQRDQQHRTSASGLFWGALKSGTTLGKGAVAVGKSGAGEDRKGDVLTRENVGRAGFRPLRGECRP
jgi:hypothetical protein